MGNSAKSRGSSSISFEFLQALVVVVAVRPTEGGAPEEPAVEVGEKLMFAEKTEDGGRRGSYIFAGPTPCFRSRKEDSLTIGREVEVEEGEVYEVVSVKGGICVCVCGACIWIGIACGGLP